MLRTYPIQLLVGTIIAFSAAPTRSAIFDRDDRQYVSAAERSAYSPIGQVTQGWIMPYRATGFLVDDCHVLTTQSVLGYGQAPLGKRLTFKAAFRTPEQVSTKGTVVAAGGLRRNKTMREQLTRGGRDWLLLRLDQCVGATLGHVTLKAGPFSPYEFRDLRSAGYPDARRHNGLTLDPSCRVTGGLGTVWLNDCATQKGDAGDPIFRLSSSGGKPRMEVYAMQSAGYTSGTPVPYQSGYDNEAVPIALIADQIKPYLSAKSRPGAGGGGF